MRTGGIRGNAAGFFLRPENGWLWVETNGIPFWDRCTTHFRTYFSGDWDVHWGLTGILPRGRLGWFGETSSRARAIGQGQAPLSEQEVDELLLFADPAARQRDTLVWSTGRRVCSFGWLCEGVAFLTACEPCDPCWPCLPPVCGVVELRLWTHCRASFLQSAAKHRQLFPFRAKDQDGLVNYKEFLRRLGTANLLLT